MASKRHLRRRGCESKTAFAERWQAVNVLKRLKNNSYTGGTYKCPHCGHWHIGRPKTTYIEARINRVT